MHIFVTIKWLVAGVTELTPNQYMHFKIANGETWVLNLTTTTLVMTRRGRYSQCRDDGGKESEWPIGLGASNKMYVQLVTAGGDDSVLHHLVIQ
jgi:hypothetical protein